jgi:hypothetical protein
MSAGRISSACLQASQMPSAEHCRGSVCDSVCTMFAAYNEYTAVVEAEMLPAKKRARKRELSLEWSERDRRREQFEGKRVEQKSFYKATKAQM